MMTSGTYTDEYIYGEHNFTVLNYNPFIIKRNLSLNIIFNMDNITITNYSSNIPFVTKNITNNSIYFVWNDIPANNDDSPGAIYFTISINRIPIIKGNRILSLETRPPVKVSLEGFNEDLYVEIINFY